MSSYSCLKRFHTLSVALPSLLHHLALVHAQHLPLPHHELAAYHHRFHVRHLSVVNQVRHRADCRDQVRPTHVHEGQVCQLPSLD